MSLEQIQLCIDRKRTLTILDNIRQRPIFVGQHKALSNINHTFCNHIKDNHSIILKNDRVLSMDTVDVFNIKRHRSKKLGSYLKALYKDAYPDSVYDGYRNLVVSQMTSQSAEFEIISGDNLYQVYNQNLIYYSCMSGKTYTKFYAENPDVVEMLVYYYENIQARALIFTTTTGERVLDRIYPCTGSHVDAIHQYAVDNDILIRDHINLPKTKNTFGGKTFKIKMKVPPNNEYPYMDSFCYGWIDAPYVHLSSACGDENLKLVFTTTDGVPWNLCQKCFTYASSTRTATKCGRCANDDN